MSGPLFLTLAQVPRMHVLQRRRECALIRPRRGYYFGDWQGGCASFLALSLLEAVGIWDLAGLIGAWNGACPMGCGVTAEDEEGAP